MNADPYARYNNTLPPTPPARSQQESALFSFPFAVLLAYVYPTPTTFARQKRDLVASNVLFCLVLFLLTGLCGYLWGRLPALNSGITILSFAHLVPHPLTIAAVVALAVVTTGGVLAFAGALHWLAHAQQGQGKYRAQLYSVLVIATPPLLLGFAVVLLLCIAPSLALLIRLPFVVILCLLFVYSLLLHVPALMGIQQLKIWQAVLCVALLVVAVLLVFMLPNLFDSNHDGNGNNGSGDRRFTKPRRGKARFCPHCGFSLEVYDQLHKEAPTQLCPKCGRSLLSF
jgi:hypothetical protein